MDRVLRPGGVIAVLGYNFHEAVGCAGAEEFNALRKRMFEEEGDFARSWDPRARHVFEGEYRTIPQLTYEDKERCVEVNTLFTLLNQSDVSCFHHFQRRLAFRGCSQHEPQRLPRGAEDLVWVSDILQRERRREIHSGVLRKVGRFREGSRAAMITEVN